MSASLQVLNEGFARSSDGRRLHFIVQGEQGGFPVFSHHGTPGSGRARHPDPSVYGTALVVSYDRPGYGGSDPHPGRTVASAADDVRAIADELGLERFATVGVSGGGPHTLAVAALLPERVTRCGILVGAGPSDDPDFDFLAGMSPSNIDEFKAAQEGEEVLAQHLEPFAQAAAREPASVIESILEELPETDQEVFGRPPVKEMFRQGMIDALKQGTRGWIEDDLAFAKPWGFDLADVRAQTQIWQGERDVLVPRSHGEYLAARLPTATFELVPGRGHFLLDEFPAVFAWLAGDE